MHVSATGHNFIGQKTYTIDSKSRVAVQPAWRPANGADLILVYSKTKGVPMLKVITPELLTSHLDLIANSAGMNEAQKSEKRRNLAARCWDAGINEQGKLLIPRELCDRLNLQPEAEVLQIGCINYFEIWNKALFDEDVQLNLDDSPSAASYINNDDVGGF